MLDGARDAPAMAAASSPGATWKGGAAGAAGAGSAVPRRSSHPSMMAMGDRMLDMHAFKQCPSADKLKFFDSLFGTCARSDLVFTAALLKSRIGVFSESDVQANKLANNPFWLHALVEEYGCTEAAEMLCEFLPFTRYDNFAAAEEILFVMVRTASLAPFASRVRVAPNVLCCTLFSRCCRGGGGGGGGGGGWGSRSGRAARRPCVPAVPLPLPAALCPVPLALGGVAGEAPAWWFFRLHDPPRPRATVQFPLAFNNGAAYYACR